MTTHCTVKLPLHCNNALHCKNVLDYTDANQAHEHPPIHLDLVSCTAGDNTNALHINVQYILCNDRILADAPYIHSQAFPSLPSRRSLQILQEFPHLQKSSKNFPTSKNPPRISQEIPPNIGQQVWKLPLASPLVGLIQGVSSHTLCAPRSSFRLQAFSPMM